MFFILFIGYGLIFGSPLTFLPSWLNLTNIVILLSLFSLIIYRVKFNVKILLFYLIPLFIYLYYSFFSLSFDDVSFSIQVFRLIGINISSYIFCYILINRYNIQLLDFLKILSIFIILSCLVSILSIQYNDIQKTINLIIQPNMNQGVLDYINNFRFNGLTGLSASELSLIYSFFFVYAGVQIGKNIKNNMILLIGSLIVLLGILIVGRTGLVSSFIFFILTCLFLKKYRFVFLCLMGVFVFVGLSYVVYINSDIIPFNIRYIALWAFEPIYKAVFLSELSSSNEVLSKMWFLPQSTSTILFGIGSWGELIIPPNGMYRPDPGYMRMMYQHGVIIEFIGLSIIISSIFIIKRSFQKSIYCILLFVALLFNIKEAYIYRDPLFSLLSICFYFSVIKKDMNDVE